MNQHVIDYYNHKGQLAQACGYPDNAIELWAKAQHFEYLQEIGHE